MALGAWLLLFPSSGQVILSGRPACVHATAVARARASTEADARAEVEVDAIPRARVTVDADPC